MFAKPQPQRVRRTAAAMPRPNRAMPAPTSANKRPGRGLDRHQKPAAELDQQQAGGSRQHRTADFCRALRGEVQRGAEPEKAERRPCPGEIGIGSLGDAGIAGEQRDPQLRIDRHDQADQPEREARRCARGPRHLARARHRCPRQWPCRPSAPKQRRTRTRSGSAEIPAASPCRSRPGSRCRSRPGFW